MKKLFASLVCCSLCVVMAMADDAAKGKKVEFDVHANHFQKNNAGLKGASSYLVFTDYASFDKVFGVAVTMDKLKPNFVVKDTFDKKMIIAVIKRGNAPIVYKVNSVTAEGEKLFVQYTTKAEMAQPTATFASPLIVSVAKNDYKSVEYIENGKKVDLVEDGKTTPEKTTKD